jgi:hypothetical protein
MHAVGMIWAYYSAPLTWSNAIVLANSQRPMGVWFTVPTAGQDANCISTALRPEDSKFRLDETIRTAAAFVA